MTADPMQQLAEGQPAKWRVQRIKTRTVNISHPWMAQAPGCPDGPHPTRTCGCKPFRTEAAAYSYIVDQVTIHEG